MSTTSSIIIGSLLIITGILVLLRGMHSSPKGHANTADQTYKARQEEHLKSQDQRLKEGIANIEILELENKALLKERDSLYEIYRSKQEKLKHNQSAPQQQ